MNSWIPNCDDAVEPDFWINSLIARMAAMAPGDSMELIIAEYLGCPLSDLEVA